jgi:hypothetical protein
MQTVSLGRTGGFQVPLFHCCHAFSIGYTSHYIHVSKTDLLTVLSLVMHRHSRKHLLNFKMKSVNVAESTYTQNYV